MFCNDLERMTVIALIEKQQAKGQVCEPTR